MSSTCNVLSWKCPDLRCDKIDRETHWRQEPLHDLNCPCLYSQVSTDAREYVLRFLRRSHPDKNVFRQLGKRLTAMVLVNTGHLPLRMPKLQLRNHSRVKIHAISRENWVYPSVGSSEYFLTIHCIIVPTQLVTESTSVFKGLYSRCAIFREFCRRLSAPYA